MNILIIAPHRDDEVIGVGGTIAKYAAAGHKVFVCIVTHGMEPMCSAELDEKIRQECVKAGQLLGTRETIFLHFPAALLDTVPRSQLNDALIQTIQRIKPEIVYIPHRGDIHLDHKITAEAAMVALRPKYAHTVGKIYAYETLSETGWDAPNMANEFIPTSFNDITDYLDAKLEAMKLYTTQLEEYPHSRSLEAMRALALYRGTQVKLCAAEAFALIREIQ